MNQTYLTIATFNILARGLAEGEFLCEGGDKESIFWEKRGPKIVNVLTKMLETCDVVVTQENDSFFYLLNQIRINNPNIKGIYCLKTSVKDGIINPTNARSIRTISLLNQYIEAGLSELLTPLPTIPKDLNHDQHYAMLNQINQKKHKFDTFNQECGQYGPEFAQLYGKNGDDIYVSDDGIGLYYNSNRLSLNNQYDQLVIDIPIVFNQDGWLKSIFTLDQHAITVFGAHLPSGETSFDEEKRVVILKKIMEQANQATYPLIAMDSNNSVEYESKYNLSETTSSVITYNGFVDSVPKKGFECFKTRHNMGNQPQKYCQLMLDTIDKILYKNVELIPIEIDQFAFGFTRYDPNHYQTIYEIRTNDQMRKEFQDKCTKSSKTDDSLIMFPDSIIFQGLYPNKKACSDHPPIFSKFVIS